MSRTLRAREVRVPTANDALIENSTRRKAHWVKPTIVAEVFHQGLGGQGLLRHPALKAIRADKKPATLKAGSGRSVDPRVRAGSIVRNVQLAAFAE